jgi:hypothetical protein
MWMETDELRRLDVEIAVRLFDGRVYRARVANAVLILKIKRPTFISKKDFEDCTEAFLRGDLEFTERDISFGLKGIPRYTTDHNAAALVVAEMWKHDAKTRRKFHLHLQDLSCARLLALHDDRTQGLDCAFFMPWEDPAIIVSAALKALDHV